MTGPRCRRPARSPTTDRRSRLQLRRRRIEPDRGGGADQQRLAHHRQHSLSASDTVTAASLDNTGRSIYGSSANQALLDVTAGSAGFGTAGTLSGNVELFDDSAIEFASGQISTIAAGCAADPRRKRRLHRGQHGARLEQRADRARFDRRRATLDLDRRLGVDDRARKTDPSIGITALSLPGARQQRHWSSLDLDGELRSTAGGSLGRRLDACRSAAR